MAKRDELTDFFEKYPLFFKFLSVVTVVIVVAFILDNFLPTKIIKESWIGSKSIFIGRSSSREVGKLIYTPNHTFIAPRAFWNLLKEKETIELTVSPMLSCVSKVGICRDNFELGQYTIDTYMLKSAFNPYLLGGIIIISVLCFFNVFKLPFSPMLQIVASSVTLLLLINVINEGGTTY
ncbi:MAG: hypothetical protein H7Y04_10785 [Verrucomicrobia bacterium]|nr:hypothetical protein [Cytophagales bacterium]